VSIHAEAPYLPAAPNTDKDAETLLGWAKELGELRPPGALHDGKTMLRAADAGPAGVVGETRSTGGLNSTIPKVLAKAEQQLDERSELRAITPP